jgi:hypothetical protein
VHINNSPTGAISVNASQVPAGSVVSCDCLEPEPVCPLPPGESWCANLQTSDCIVDGPAVEQCRVRALTSTAAGGGPQILECDCLGDECGPVRITPDATGQGFIYSCPGPCPNPALPCQVFFDDGAGPTPTGQTSVHSSNVPPGVIVTCDCPPPPQEEGCCLDGACFNTFPNDCIAQGGTPQGAGNFCTGVVEACCLPDFTCVMVEALCCDDLGGTPQGGGSTCQGDSDGDGHDDLCDPPVLCELGGNPDYCLPLAFPDCVQDDPNDIRCWPRRVYGGVVGGPPPVDACECFADECGPVVIQPHPQGGFIYSCPGPCTGAPQEFCQIHLDNGFNRPRPTGQTSIWSANVPPNLAVTCDCSLRPCKDADVNCDTNVTAADIGVVVNPLNWLKSPPVCDRTDVNHHGSPTAADIGVIVNPVNWLTSSGPCACYTLTPGMGGCPL